MEGRYRSSPLGYPATLDQRKWGVDPGQGRRQVSTASKEVITSAPLEVTVYRP